MLLDCNTLDCEYLPLKLGDCSLVITNCNKPHSLVESKYNERRAETDEALKLLQQRFDIRCLADLSALQDKSYLNILPVPLKRRVEHVVSECERVRCAAIALRVGDTETLGRLLNASHKSLKELYEVTGREPDALAEAAQSELCCLGSRLIGGGFGGCTISLVKSGSVDGFKENVYNSYFKATGYKAEFYETEISDGIVVEKC